MSLLSQQRLLSLLDRARSERVVVVGDLVLDCTVRGGAGRLSGAGPFPVVEVSSETVSPGAAANVAKGVCALGARGVACGLLGWDECGETLSHILCKQGVEQAVARSESRRTSHKTRVMARQQYLLQIDRLSKGPLTEIERARLVELFENAANDAKAVILSDYGLGVADCFLPVVEHCAGRGIFVALDPNLGRFAPPGLSLLTPNRSEAFALVGARDPGAGPDPLQDGALLDVAARIRAQCGVEMILVTLSQDGMLLLRKGAPPFHAPAEGPEVVDILGAGDTVIAAFAVAIAAGATPEEATLFASRAAGIAVSKLGTAAVTRDEMLGR